MNGSTSAKPPLVLTISQFRRKYRISNEAWADLADRGNLPRIQRGERGRQFITEASASDWYRRQLEAWFKAPIDGGESAGQ